MLAKTVILCYATSMQKIAILKVGGSLYFRLPMHIKHKFDLEAGQTFYILPNKDGTIFKFIKQERADELEELMPEEQAAE